MLVWLAIINTSIPVVNSIYIHAARTTAFMQDFMQDINVASHTFIGGHMNAKLVS